MYDTYMYDTYMNTTIKDIASGLSEATIYRDIRLGHLERRFLTHDLIEWLIKRRQRCGGLTIESKLLLEKLTRQLDERMIKW